MRKKIGGILLPLCLLSFTACSNGNVSDSMERIDVANTSVNDTEVVAIEASIEKETELSETVPTKTPLSDIDFTQFESMMNKEDYVAFENYFPILSGDLKFKYQSWTDKTEDLEVNLNELCELDVLIRLHMFTIFDLDDDGIKELILCFDNVGEHLIFHHENGSFFVKALPYRGFKNLQNSGIYQSSGSAACTHYNKLLFENGEFTEQEVGHACIYEDETYTVDGDSASEEEFENWKEEIMTGDVEWYNP